MGSLVAHPLDSELPIPSLDSHQSKPVFPVMIGPLCIAHPVHDYRVWVQRLVSYSFGRKLHKAHMACTALVCSYMALCRPCDPAAANGQSLFGVRQGQTTERMRVAPCQLGLERSIPKLQPTTSEMTYLII